MAILFDQDVSLRTGDDVTSAITIPNGSDLLDIRVMRSTTANPGRWPNAATTIRYAIECDYGQGRKFEVSTGPEPIPGGIQTRSDQTEVQFVRITLQGMPAVPSRRLFLTTTIENGPLATRVLVQTES